MYKDIQSDDENWRDITKKGVYAGAIGSVGAYLLFGETGQSSFMNMQLPAALTAGVGAGLGSVSSDLLSGYVINKLDQTNEMKSVESRVIKLGVAGVGTVAALKFGSGIEPSLNGALLGVGAKFGGDAVHFEMDPLSFLL